ncbi:17702_t:CDS:1, partial [Funneliformis geosporum]
MSVEFLPQLSKNFTSILDDDEYYDVTIEVGQDPEVKIFRAHMVILNYRSAYFRRALSTTEKNSYNTLVHIKLQDMAPNIFQIIL